MSGRIELPMLQAYIESKDIIREIIENRITYAVSIQATAHVRQKNKNKKGGYNMSFKKIMQIYVKKNEIFYI